MKGLIFALGVVLSPLTAIALPNKLQCTDSDQKLEFSLDVLDVSTNFVLKHQGEEHSFVWNKLEQSRDMNSVQYSVELSSTDGGIAKLQLFGTLKMFCTRVDCHFIENIHTLSFKHDVSKTPLSCEIKTITLF